VPERSAEAEEEAAQAEATFQAEAAKALAALRTRKGSRGRPSGLQRGSSGLEEQAEVELAKAGHGTKRKRQEEWTAAVKLEVCKYLQANRCKFSEEKSFWKAMVWRYGRSRNYLTRLLARQERREDFVKSRKLGLGTGDSKYKARGTQQGLMGRRWRSQGKRSKGGGRKDRFAHFKVKVKHFLERERSYGHSVDLEELCQELLPL
jgi:hypothetical protein